MYRSDLGKKDKGGAIFAAAAINAALLLALVQASGTIDLTDPQSVTRVFDVTEEIPPPPISEPVEELQQREREKPKEAEGAASPENIRSQTTPIVDPKPRIELPLPVPMAVSETPRQGAQATQGAADVRGPGTGAGGTGTGTGSGGSGSGSGGGGGYVVPPRLVTPDLRGRDFPQQMLRAWPRGAPVFSRVRVGADGSVIQCIVDRGTGNRAIDSQVCATIQARLRYSPARNAAGQAVAGWSGYVQEPPR